MTARRGGRRRPCGLTAERSAIWEDLAIATSVWTPTLASRPLLTTSAGLARTRWSSTRTARALGARCRHIACWGTTSARATTRRSPSRGGSSTSAISIRATPSSAVSSWNGSDGSWTNTMWTFFAWILRASFSGASFLNCRRLPAFRSSERSRRRIYPITHASSKTCRRAERPWPACSTSPSTTRPWRASVANGSPIRPSISHSLASAWRSSSPRLTPTSTISGTSWTTMTRCASLRFAAATRRASTTRWLGPCWPRECPSSTTARSSCSRPCGSLCGTTATTRPRRCTASSEP
mmetsp:Transcript_29606/g.84419  ORF Transcript_29606/g.84419 Transcript_29606/m.84419 type:complete len:294 (-) Transcript_29606:629-1510(-)